MDATVFLRFTKLCRNLFLVLSVVGCGVIIPTNIVNSDHDITHGLSAFQVMTPMYMFGQTLWSHVVCAWLFDVIVAYFLWRNYIAITRLRRQYLQSPEYRLSLQSRTLLVSDIPPTYRTDEGILRIMDEAEQTSGLPRAAIGRNVKELPQLIERYEKVYVSWNRCSLGILRIRTDSRPHVRHAALPNTNGTIKQNERLMPLDT